MSDMGKAGGSARREYERRLEKHKQLVRRTFRILIVAVAVLAPLAWVLADRYEPGYGPWASAIVSLGLITHLLPSRGHVDAWAVGSEGEVKTAKTLDRLGEEFVVLHDRRIPRKRANIDHIVVGPSGVFVVETKNVAGKVTVWRGELFVAGRRNQGFVEETWREAVAVQEVLSEVTARLGINVQPLMCFHRADLPWGRTEVAGVPIVYPKGMLKALRNGRQVLSPADVGTIASTLDQRLRSASAVGELLALPVSPRSSRNSRA